MESNVEEIIMEERNIVEDFIKDTLTEYERLRNCHRSKEQPVLGNIFKTKTEDLRRLQKVLKMEIAYREITGYDDPGVFCPEAYKTKY